MDIKVFPSKVAGSISVPASKSVVHRALIASALSDGTSIIDCVDLNEDILATIKALKALGAKISIDKRMITVKGFIMNKTLDQVEINAKESGSTMRFIIPLASYIADKVILSGTERLMERPLNVYKKIYDKQNLSFEDGSIKKIKGRLKAGKYQVDGSVSSQFISGLMFILPILDQDSTIEILEPFESKPYVDLTIELLNSFGIKIKSFDKTYFIKGKQKYKPHNLKAEKDFSQAAFFMILGAINSEITINNLNMKSAQGDRQLIDFLKSLNVKIKTTKDSITVYKSELASGVLDLADTPDLGPILCVMALFSKNYIRLENVGRLRIKESDRLSVMKCQLEKIGAKVKLEKNSITIYRLDNFIDQEIVVSGANDHRIVMAMAILATVVKKPLIIKKAEAINKSYPNFFKDLKTLGVKVEYL